MVIFNSYVSLPEGKSQQITIKSPPFFFRMHYQIAFPQQPVTDATQRIGHPLHQGSRGALSALQNSLAAWGDHQHECHMISP